MEGGDATKKILADLRGYLQDNLPVDGDLISELQGRNLLSKNDADRLRTAVAKGGTDGVCGLLDYMHSYYNEEMLETFCVFLEEYSKPAKPVLLTVATRIREEMKRYQPHPNQPAEGQQDVSGPSGTGSLPMESSTPHPPETTRDGVPGPSGIITDTSEFLSYIDAMAPHLTLLGTVLGIEGFATATVEGYDNPQSKCLKILKQWMNVTPNHTWKSFCKKLEKSTTFNNLRARIEDHFDSGTGPLPMESSSPHPSETTRDDVPGPSGTNPPVDTPTSANAATRQIECLFCPVIDELNGDFSDLATEVLKKIKSLEASERENLCTFLANFLKPKALPSLPPPRVPIGFDELKSFLISRWDPLQIQIIQEVIRKRLKTPTLSKQLSTYVRMMKKKITAFLSDCKTKNVPYKRLPHHVSVAVTIDCTPREVSLSRILELKEFFVSKLRLGEALFEGFRESSTILYFSIPEDSDWCLPLCLHPSNLRQLKEWQVTSLLVEGKFTVNTDYDTVDIIYEDSLSKHKYMIDAMISDPFKLRDMMQSAAKHKYRNEEMMSEVTQLREKVAENEKESLELQQSVVEHNYRNEELMRKNSQLRDKIAVMEESLRYYQEEGFEERKIFSPSQAPETKVKLETSFAMTSPHFEHKFKIEPPTKKPKLEESDYEEMKPKLEHELKPETFHSKEEHETELGKVYPELELESNLEKGDPKLEKEDPKLEHESKLEKEDPKLEHESKLEKGDPKLEIEDPKLEHESKLEKEDPKPELEPDTEVTVEEKGKLTSSEEVQQETIRMLREFEETIHKLRLFEEEKLKLSHLYWRKEPDVLEEMRDPTAVFLNGKIFICDRVNYRKSLCVFDVVSRTWSKLPFHDSCEMYGFTLAASNSKVHTIGGTWRKDGKEEKYSNKVFSLDDDLKWCNTLPPLNIGRENATSTSFDRFILVAGGEDRNGLLSSVEVLNSSQSSSTWWEICDLPVKSHLMQCTVTHDELFIGCGFGNECTLHTSKLSAVKESLNVDKDSESSVSPESFWQSLHKTPLRLSGLVSVNNCLLTVGGLDDDPKLHSSVHLYDCYKKTWSKVSNIRKSREYPAVVVITFENKQELFVLGGYHAVTSVESCELLLQ